MAAATSSSMGSRRQDEESEFNLKEWGMRAKIISNRENPSSSSRRFSGSHIRSSFREVVDSTRSFRSNITVVSSTASSPGYSLREEIDPSTYSFTTALKALQARTVYSWEYNHMYSGSGGGDGLALNSKWNEAEKYICNPKSGEVPLECLSAKSLTSSSSSSSATATRSFRNLLASKLTMSAPLIYPSSKNFHSMLPSTISNVTTTTSTSLREEQEQEQEQDDYEEIVVLPITSTHETKGKKKKKISMTRDIGTQSTPPHHELRSLGSGSPSPAPTPSIQESPRKHNSPLSTEKFISETVMENESSENLKEEEDKMINNNNKNDDKMKKITTTTTTTTNCCKSKLKLKSKTKSKSKCKCKSREQEKEEEGGGCLSWSLWMKKERIPKFSTDHYHHHHQQQQKQHRQSKKNIFLHHC